MRSSALLLLLATAAPAQSWTVQRSNTTASLRGIAAVSGRVAWASGTQGTFLIKADGGETWTAAQVPGAEKLDFRDVHALDERTAWLMAAGPGDASRIFHTADGGAHWTLQYVNPDAAGFFDAIAIWDAQHGLALGDPVHGRFVILETADGGAHWAKRAGPAALPQEGAFAASGTCLIVSGYRDAWFATGGGRVFRSNNRGATWTAASTPVRHDGSGAGIFSLAFAGAARGVAVGGDYTNANVDEHNVAITPDGGRTWTEPVSRPAGYRSAVVYVPSLHAWIATGTTGSDLSTDDGQTWKRFDTAAYNAIGFPFAVGPKGAVARFSAK
jgi:photosystem II stability/assembly factor-like uncharacterized protein